MPNAALLSEVHPLSQLHVSVNPRFAPTDMIYLALKGGFSFFDELSINVFKAEITVISKHVKQLGKYLIIREHSHSDYLVGNCSVDASTIKTHLQDDHPLLCIMTVRHPVDSYLSLLTNEGWARFTPSNFDEYCKRYMLFLEHNRDVPMYKYENFVDNPDQELKQMCDALELPFNEGFQDIFDLNFISGDSGRSSNIIEKRERRKIDDTFKKEIAQSHEYRKLCERLDYTDLLND